jgi:hypothetical protein
MADSRRKSSVFHSRKRQSKTRGTGKPARQHTMKSKGERMGKITHAQATQKTSQFKNKDWVVELKDSGKIYRTKKLTGRLINTTGQSKDV